MDSIKVTLPDGSVMEVERGSTPRDVAQRIGPRLAKAAVAAKVDGVVTDLARPLHKDVQLEILTTDSPEGLEVLRHSTAHLMAQAIRRLFPGTKLAIGPVVGERFYYDIDCPKSLTVEDFEAIEKEMAKNRRGEPSDRTGRRSARPTPRRSFTQWTSPLSWRSWRGSKTGRSRCTGRGSSSTCAAARTCPVRVTSRRLNCSPWPARIWRGDSSRPMLQRIYGTAFPKQSELEEYLHRLEEAARRDHRRLGPALGLFTPSRGVARVCLTGSPKG